MKQKELDLLFVLFQNQECYLTSEQLATKLSLSQRTIRTYLQNLQTICNQNGAKIIAKQGYGYMLQLTNPMQFETFLNKQHMKTIGKSEKTKALENAMDRQSYILNKLLIEDDTIYFDQIEQKLFISRSTLSKEIHKIKQLLKPYNLCVVSKSNYGTYVEGDEPNKRSFIMNYFFKGVRFNSIQDYINHTSYFDDLPKESFIMIILEVCRQNQIKLSDVMVQNILMHLILSIKRIEKGLELKHFELDSSFSNSIEYKSAYAIIERLKLECNLHFPKEEVAYLALHLGAKNNRPLNDGYIEVDLLKQELSALLKKMECETMVPFSNDSLLINCLLEHLRPMLIRIQKKIILENPLKDEIIQQHCDVYQLCTQYMSQMPCLAKDPISQDEWAYLTLHFLAAMERLQQKDKIQALVICSTGCGSAQLLKSRIEKEFSDTINIVCALGYYELQKEILQDIDVIITSVNLDSVIFSIPVISVSIFLNDKDKQTIKQFIFQAHSKKQGIQHNSCSYETNLISKQAIFDSFIKRSYFQIFEGEVCAKSVVDVLIERISKTETKSFKQKMKDQIRLRESMGSFIFSDAIVVPHPAIPISEKAAIAIAIVKEGCVWNAQFKAIKFVFLVSPSFLSNQDLKIMTSAIIKLIDQTSIQNKLLQCESFSQFRDEFLKIM